MTLPPIQAGAPIAERILREAAPEILEEHTAAALRRLGGTPLAPGEVRTFEALVLEANLPEQARRVLLEVGESRRGALRAAPAIPAIRVEESGAEVSVAADPSPVPIQLEAESVLSP